MITHTGGCHCGRVRFEVVAPARITGHSVNARCLDDNARGTVHGGILATLADVALGYATAFSSTPPANLVTANLALDFTGTAAIGDWLEAHVDVQKRGSRLAFANCYITANEQRIARASAVFLVANTA